MPEPAVKKPRSEAAEQVSAKLRELLKRVAVTARVALLASPVRVLRAHHDCPLRSSHTLCKLRTRRQGQCSVLSGSQRVM